MVDMKSNMILLMISTTMYSNSFCHIHIRYDYITSPRELDVCNQRLKYETINYGLYCQCLYCLYEAKQKIQYCFTVVGQ